MSSGRELSASSACSTLLADCHGVEVSLRPGYDLYMTRCVPSHWTEFQDPYGIVVLLQNDLVVVDLTSPGYPCFENPYPMDLHGSAVTSCTYLADCPGDLVPALYSVGTAKQNRSVGGGGRGCHWGRGYRGGEDRDRLGGSRKTVFESGWRMQFGRNQACNARRWLSIVLVYPGYYDPQFKRNTRTLKLNLKLMAVNPNKPHLGYHIESIISMCVVGPTTRITHC